MKKTIAQKLMVTEFPYVLNDSDGNEIYYEDSKGYWAGIAYNNDDKKKYFINSNGHIRKTYPKSVVLSINELTEEIDIDINKLVLLVKINNV